MKAKWRSKFIQRGLVALSVAVAACLLVVPPTSATGDDTTVTANFPLISDVSANNITQSSAIISWNTSINATSQVFYDTTWHASTANYSANVTDNTPLAVHSIPLSGLASSTTYHYRVCSTANSTDYVSDDYIFTTLSGGGVGGGAPRPGVVVEPGVFDVSDVVNAEGEFEQNVTIESEDEKVELDINEGTVGKTKENEPLSEISILEMEEPPDPPADASIIGLTYDLGPDGATFDPPITITFTYDPDELPEGFDEENLVIAIWNEAAGKWVKLENCIVDPVTHTIRASASHFTTFSVLAYTLRPAAFYFSSLSIYPTEVYIGQTVIIRASFTNTADLSGSYEVTLKIDNVVVETKEVTLAGGASQTVSFTTTKDAAGTYSVDVNGLAVTFTVKVEEEEEVPAKPAAFTIGTLTISQTEVDIGDSVTINAVVTNTGDISGSYEVTLKIDDVVVETKKVTLTGGASQMVSFTTARDVAGTYTVNVNGLSSTFTVKAKEAPAAAPAAPEEDIVWWIWLIVGIAAVVVIVLLAYFLWWRQRF